MAKRSSKLGRGLPKKGAGKFIKAKGAATQPGKTGQQSSFAQMLAGMKK